MCAVRNTRRLGRVLDWGDTGALAQQANTPCRSSCVLLRFTGVEIRDATLWTNSTKGASPRHRKGHRWGPPLGYKDRSWLTALDRYDPNDAPNAAEEVPTLRFVAVADASKRKRSYRNCRTRVNEISDANVSPRHTCAFGALRCKPAIFVAYVWERGPNSSVEKTN